MYPLTIRVQGPDFLQVYHAENEFEAEVLQLLAIGAGFDAETESGTWTPETAPHWRNTLFWQQRLYEARYHLRLQILDIITNLA